jgi:hypothetical protein
MTNTNLNDVAIDIIAVVYIWNLTQMLYNVVQVEYGPLYKNKAVYLFTFSTIFTFTKFYKYS